MIKHGGCHSCYWDNEKEHNERRILWLYNTKESTNPMPWLTISALMQLVSMVHVTSITVLLTNRALMANELNFVFNWLAVRFQRNKYFLVFLQLLSMVHVTSLTVLLTNRALMSNKLNFVYNWLAVRFQRHKYSLAYPKTVTLVLTCILINPWKRCYRILVSW